ncbi:MAG: methyltransferase domain-containing protein [Simkania sp.]|nr:methyltransferase domain-containing protein [Simkania sp.]
MSIQGTTTQIKTASQGYDDDFITLVEMVYGKGFLSQGGNAFIDKLFEGVALNQSKLLDLGSGLGAVDLYLATHHEVEIVGIDPQKMMVKRSNDNLSEVQVHLKGTVSFVLMENPIHLKQFEDHTFDLIFSKESILHVPLEYKAAYFKEIYRVLKPGGEILIMDWMHASPNYSANTKKMMEMDEVAFCLITPAEYTQFLENAGFVDISLTDTSLDHAQISQENIDTIKNLAGKITEQFGESNYLYSLESWGFQRDAFASRELLTGVFRAQKPSLLH